MRCAATRNHHVELVAVLLASVGVQVIRVLQAYCLGRALAIDVPLGTYFVLIPIVLLVMQMPITVSGLGTSQVAFQYLFGQAACPRRRPSRSRFCSSRSASSATCRAACSTRSTPIGARRGDGSPR